MQIICAIMITMQIMIGTVINMGAYKHISSFYIEVLDEDTKEYMRGKSYPGSDGDVSLDELRQVHILHYDFGGKVKKGSLIVHEMAAEDVCDVFKKLFEHRYPLHSVLPIDVFEGNDEQSMTANNTSAFNYRKVDGSNVLSSHGRGMAVDINPLQNPYVKGNTVLPRAGGAYVDRTGDFAGKIDKVDLAAKLFKEKGWIWGGDWHSLKDYQHFEKKIP